MHCASTAKISIAELAPRRLFHDLALAAAGPAPTMQPSAVLVRTMLTAFMEQEDYAAAIVVLRTFGTYGTAGSLTNGMFGAVINPLIRRLRNDAAAVGEAGWGARFLGTPLSNAHRPDKTIQYMADQASRESFDVTDPLGALTSLDTMMLPAAERLGVVRRESLEVTWGPIAHKLPIHRVFPYSNRDLRPNRDDNTQYSIIPLERLLLRAIFADVMLPEKDQTVSVQKVWDIVRRAEEDMLPPPTAEH
ncbi:hypothetical protein HYPSUDRAFT_207317 [Hypholoma sublateritium FD-334 SS-4]|uniref:Uncharacterized protein n=1 Tax=Hypholoma sublateritium (strain FD-334 SS-4) TaxID=945553 RepID=A0A0D2KN77_HYPSF|nr:hypothetical protein HYPSUDRAFT_207317 [Hypholoma sublateritium FD-334 SS-4]